MARVAVTGGRSNGQDASNRRRRRARFVAAASLLLGGLVGATPVSPAAAFTRTVFSDRVSEPSRAPEGRAAEARGEVVPDAAAPGTSRRSQPQPPAPVPANAREVFTRAAPAVVAIVLTAGTGASASATPAAVPGVVVTASGLVLTSLSALGAAADGGSPLAVVGGGKRGRPTSRELGAALPARLVARAPSVDLALVEILSTASTFFPHLPIVRAGFRPGLRPSTPSTARPSIPDDEVRSALAVGHVGPKGLWAAGVVAIGRRTVSARGEREPLRELTWSGFTVAPGAPIVDAVGRIVGLAVRPADAIASSTSLAAPVAVTADTLWRFVMVARASELRFAGVPPQRRSTPALLAAAGPKPPRPIGRSVRQPETRAMPAESLPTVVTKGAIDRHFAASANRASTGGTAKASAAGANRAGVESGARPGSGIAIEPVDAVTVTASDLERFTLPVTWKAPGGLPMRGSDDARVTVVELGDYHSPQTREAERELRALLEQPGAIVRLAWQDTDRGFGDDYYLAPRAARAAGEQFKFWEFHDEFLAAATPATTARVRALIRKHGLDENAFDQSFTSAGLTGSVDKDAEAAAKLPVLATPAFVVNERLVDGGSIAIFALRDAINQESWATQAATNGAPWPSVPIAPGPALPGVSLDRGSVAQVMAALRRAVARPQN